MLISLHSIRELIQVRINLIRILIRIIPIVTLIQLSAGQLVEYSPINTVIEYVEVISHPLGCHVVLGSTPKFKVGLLNFVAAEVLDCLALALFGKCPHDHL